MLLSRLGREEDSFGESKDGPLPALTVPLAVTSDTMWMKRAQ